MAILQNVFQLHVDSKQEAADIYCFPNIPGFQADWQIYLHILAPFPVYNYIH